jgi:hypothetical protein
MSNVPFFRAPLVPSLRRIDGSQSPRFLLRTTWLVQRPRGAAFRQPLLLDSLLVLDDLFISVLPHSLHQGHGIVVTPLPNVSAPSWRQVPCDLGVADIWLMHENGHQRLHLRLLVRLPRAQARPEPVCPLIGTEFLRRYSPRLDLGYGSFTWGLAPNLRDPVGYIEW